MISVTYFQCPYADTLLYYICYIASMGRPEILFILYSEVFRYYSSQND